MINIVIVGSGCREHAMADGLSHNKDSCNIYYFSTRHNIGMDKIATYRQINPGGNDYNSDIYDFLNNMNIDIVIIGPEDYIAEGVMYNTCQKLNITCIAPSPELAKIESSKTFCRKLIQSNYFRDQRVYQPDWCSFSYENDDYKYAHEVIYEHKGTCVIKRDGLYRGKGVKVFINDIDGCVEFVEELISKKEKFIIEEKLVGEEFTLTTFTDGRDYVHTFPLQDYKKLENNDNGPNTGGMGCISGNLNFLNEYDIECVRRMNECVLDRLSNLDDDFPNTNKETYVGFLYGNYMKTDNGIYLIEYNCRPGDPEMVHIVSAMKNNFLDVIVAMANKQLCGIKLEFDDFPRIFKYWVPKSYPNPPQEDEDKTFYLPNYITCGSGERNMFCGDMTVINDEYKYNRSRTFGILYTGHHDEIVEHIDRDMEKIKGNLFCRTDIGLKKLSYGDSGVDVDEGNHIVETIEKNVVSTYNSKVISRFGDFSGLMNISDDVSLVVSMDGVGTKSIFVLDNYNMETGLYMLGKDITHHSVNDILVKGAKPLFMTDYIAANSLKKEHINHIVRGITKSCKKYGCVLLGGETAEMPGVYNDNRYDIVGTIVGSVSDETLIDGKRDIVQGDFVFGLPSNGPHTNGYSLIRKMAGIYNLSKEFKKELCNTHTCYYNHVKKINEVCHINGLCHITGGGLTHNIPRVLPDNLYINLDEYRFSNTFRKIQGLCQLSRAEMMETFNCGIGMVVIVPTDKKEAICNLDIDIIDLGYVVAK